jgi:hypothetical protein
MAAVALAFCKQNSIADDGDRAITDTEHCAPVSRLTERWSGFAATAGKLAALSLGMTAFGGEAGV